MGKKFTAIVVIAAALAFGIPQSANAVTLSYGYRAEGTLVSMTNSARKNRGLRTYVVKSDLVSIARQQSLRMARSSTLYHNPNLRTVVKSWRIVGENVGHSHSAAAVHRAFMNSTYHRANILDRAFTQVGIGVVIKGDRIWVTQVFRKPA
jgi:uncharacterized protein YkwD